jgi:outer membrane PBP1 activator LpoA protein
VSGNISVAGLTGQLSLDAQRHVRRELGWAQLHDGELRLLTPTSNL